MKPSILSIFGLVFEYCIWEDCEDDAAIRLLATDALNQAVDDGIFTKFSLLNADKVGTSVFLKVLVDEEEKEYRIIISIDDAKISDILG